MTDKPERHLHLVKEGVRCADSLEQNPGAHRDIVDALLFSDTYCSFQLTISALDFNSDHYAVCVNAIYAMLKNRSARVSPLIDTNQIHVSFAVEADKEERYQFVKEIADAVAAMFDRSISDVENIRIQKSGAPRLLQSIGINPPQLRSVKNGDPN